MTRRISIYEYYSGFPSSATSYDHGTRARDPPGEYLSIPTILDC